VALIKCKECKKEVSDKALTCPNCGAEVAKEKKKTSGCALVVLAVIIFGVISSIVGGIIANNEREAEQEQIAANARAAVAAQQAKVAAFKANPVTTIQQAEQLAAEKKWQQVVELLAPLAAANNADAQRLHDAALEQQMLGDLTKLPASDAKGNFERYQRLASLRPDNKAYGQKRDSYKKKWDEQQAKEAAEKIVFGDVPQKSAWDGCTSLVFTRHSGSPG
jgi:predicted amidophosphoribosyltransferase